MQINGIINIQNYSQNKNVHNTMFTGRNPNEYSYFLMENTRGLLNLILRKIGSPGELISSSTEENTVRFIKGEQEHILDVARFDGKNFKIKHFKIVNNHHISAPKNEQEPNLPFEEINLELQSYLGRILKAIEESSSNK